MQREESPTRKEKPDLTPVEVPFGFTYESLADTIGRMVRIEKAKSDAKAEYVESFAESQDFGEDDEEITTRHEMTELQDEMPSKWLDSPPTDEELAEELERRKTVKATEIPPASPKAPCSSS